MNNLTTPGEVLISGGDDRPAAFFIAHRRFPNPGPAFRGPMTIRPLVLLPDPRLRLVSAPIASIDDEVRALARDMLDTMYDAPGVGLAAVQIGVPKRMITMDVSKDEQERQPTVLINPQVVW